MIDKPEGLESAMDITAHALRMASAITPNASEPAEVIANADPIAEWLAEAEDEQAVLQQRLTAAYQQLDNQRGASCEVGLFLKRAQELYAFLGRVDLSARPMGESVREGQGGDG
jgi:hypothetical protein